MASKRTKAPTADDELGELFEGLDTKAPVKKATKAKPAAPKPKGGDAAGNRDVLADLESQLGEKAPERPHTPRVREVKRTSTNTPPPPSAGADASRKSAESAGSHRASFTPSATSSEPVDNEKRALAQQQQQQQQAQAQAAAGGGWWGGLLSTASAAMKQAEAAVKEIQQNEEAKKWANQVRGNVGALRGFGMSSGCPVSCIQPRRPQSNQYLHFQATNFDTVPFRPLPTSSTPSRPRSPRTSASLSTLPMISSATPRSTRSSTAYLTVSWPRSRAATCS